MEMMTLPVTEYWVTCRAGKDGKATLVSLSDGETWGTQNCLPLRKLPVGTKVEITVVDED